MLELALAIGFSVGLLTGVGLTVLIDELNTKE